MMHLHIPTLMVVVIIVNLTLCAFCVTCWYGRRDREIYFWLSLAGISSSLGCGLLMLRSDAPDWVTIWLAQGLVITASGLLWAGIRVFERHHPAPVCIVGGAIVWTLICLVPQIYGSVQARAIIVSAISATYFAFITWDIAKGFMAERIRSSAIALIVGIEHILACGLRIWLMLETPDGNWPNAIDAPPLLGALVIESIVNIVAIVLALTTMERDRAELEQRRTAATDVLTGALSRRGFIDQATNWVEGNGKEAALILFDLDHFKKINDTYGHAAGDRVLHRFAELVRTRIDVANLIAGFNLDSSTSDQYPRWYEATLADAAEGGEPIFGRLGGEEFACLLPHLTLLQAVAIANDIRSDLQMLKLDHAGYQISLGVSAGVVTTADTGHSLDMMLAIADQALYRAKHNGRNRVEYDDSNVTYPLIRQRA